MLTASNLILLYDEAATPTLYHRSTGTTSTPDLNLVSADIVNKTQYTVLEDIGAIIDQHSSNSLT